MPEPTLNAALVRILAGAGTPRRVVGAGFLVSERHVLTCAHVVEQALKLPTPTLSAPAEPLWLDLPLVPGSVPVQARPIVWHPVPAGDPPASSRRTEDRAPAPAKP